jgi:sec-independent protein translocase protein TatA
MSLLAVGVPGAPELFVIVLVAVVVLGIPLLVVLGVASGLSILGADDDEIEELRARVNELEAKLADQGDGGEPREPSEDRDA